MQLKKYKVNNIKEAMDRIKEELGEDAFILSNGAGGNRYPPRAGADGAADALIKRYARQGSAARPGKARTRASEGRASDVIIVFPFVIIANRGQPCISKQAQGG